MEIEHGIMERIMRIASQSRRKLPQPTREGFLKMPGFGRILDLLAENDGLRQQQIAENLDIRPQSASEAIANMEQAGLIRRVADEQDRRSSRAYITAEGQRLQTESLRWRLENARRVMTPLTEEEKQTLLALLEKVTDALQKTKEENEYADAPNGR